MGRTVSDPGWDSARSLLQRTSGRFVPDPFCYCAAKGVALASTRKDGGCKDFSAKPTMRGNSRR